MGQLEPSPNPSPDPNPDPNPSPNPNPNPGQESWDSLQREAGEEVVSSGVAVFWTSCGIVRATDRRCRAARALMAHKGERCLDVDLAREPSEVPPLYLPYISRASPVYLPYRARAL